MMYKPIPERILSTVIVLLLLAVATIKIVFFLGLSTDKKSIDYFILPVVAVLLLVLFTILQKNKKQQEKEQEYTRFLASIAENIQDPVFSSTTGFIINSWNKPAEQLFGWTSTEAIGKTTAEVLKTIYPGDNREQILASFKQRGAWQGEVIYHTKSGQPLNVLATMSPLRDAKGSITGNLIVVKDITERKKAAAALAELNAELEKRVQERTGQLTKSRKSLSETVERITDAFICLDRNWHCTFMNKKAGEILRCDPVEIIGKNIWSIFAEGTGHPLYKAYLPAMQNMQHVHLEEYYNGNCRWFESFVYPSPEGIAIFFHDITEKKKAGEQILKLNRLYLFISHINQMMLRVTDETTLFKEACRIAVDIGKFRMAWIGLVDEETKKVIPAVHAGEERGYLSKINSLSFADAHEGRGPTSTAVREGKYVFCNDIANDPIMAPWRKEALERGYLSSISLPIHKFGRPFGSIALYAGQKDFFNEEEINLLLETRGDICFALENFDREIMRMEAEQKVLEVYKEKETTLNRITDSVISVDNSWRYTFLNDAALATHPAGRENTLGKVIWDVHPGMKGTVFFEKYHEAMQTKQVVEIEGYYPPMNTWFFVKVYPSDDGLTVYYRNINARKKAEQDLQKEKYLLDSIINSLPGAFYLYNKNGVFLRWNKKFETITMYSRDEIREMHPLDFFDDDEKQLLAKKISDTFIYGQESVQANFLLKTKEKIPFYFTGVAIDYEGSPCLMGVGIDFSEQVRAQAEVKQTSEKLRQLAAHLITVREEERRRIGREIHDELGQQLTAVKMDIAWIDKKTPLESVVVKDKIKNIITLLDGSNKSVRRILSELRPVILDDYGLVEAIKWQGRQFTENTGIPLQFTAPDMTLKLDEGVTTSIFRVYQEALTNITRYANATKVTVLLNITGSCIEFTVEDDGIGFDASTIKSAQSFGIMGMKERVLSIGGTFQLDSSPGKGTKITITVPLKNHPAHPD